MTYAQQLIGLFRQHENEENAGPMKAYMRNQFEFLGIKTPERKELLRGFIKENGIPPLDELPEAVRELWGQPEREFQYLALTLLDKERRKLGPEHLALLEELVLRKSWWDTIDTIASRIAGFIIRKYPEEGEAYLVKWISSDNFWLNRTAILHQLSYKGETDEVKLFTYIRQHSSSREFFIEKAIGWALREYSKTAPEQVKRFIEKEDLRPLSKREGLKHVNSSKAK
ncbi:DNA alkylation repair protein [Bacillus salacetis]|uniref:DNA alkylation repair protein n=1 Tax=Bacillus salacetis TaxID=2315464 RepID=A0A3A1QS35_9BACI|nr:DNA alkylation repair protein [Bacillus salacetis]RIW29092.1 DNA alkylation repair protein [Bacillus salacetis]